MKLGNAIIHKTWNKRPFLMSCVLLAILCVSFVVATTLIPRLEARYSIRQFLPEGHALMKMDDQIKAHFNLGDGVPLLVMAALPAGEAEGWLAPGRMADLARATAFANGLPDVQGAVSLATIEGAGSTANSLTVGKLTDLVPAKDWRARFLGDALLSPNLISADARTVTLVLNVGQPEAANLARLITRLRGELAAFVPGAQVKVGGVPAIQSDMNHLLTQELYRFLIWAALACVFAVLLFFRNFSAVAISSAVIVVSNAWAVAYLAATGTPFTVLLSTLPVLVSISALAMATHVLLVFADDWRQRPHFTKAEAVADTLGRLFLPNLLVVLTTSVGFLMLAFSDVPVIRQYGISVCVAELLVWIACSMALPPLMFLLPAPQPRSWAGSRAAWVIPLLRRRKTIFTAIAGTAAVAMVIGHQLNWSARLFDDLPDGEESRVSTELMDRSMGGVIPLEVEITAPAGESDAWNDPSRVQRLREIESRWVKDPAVGSALGLPDFLAVAAEAHGGLAKLNRKAIAETVFLYSMAETNPLANFLTVDGGSTRVQFRMRDLPAEKIKVAAARIEADFRDAFPGHEIRAAGMAAIAHPMNEQLSHELITGLWHSLIIITVLLVIVFRSLRWALVAAVPNLLAPGALLATMSILHTPIKPGVALIFSIALGIAYNNTVYLLERLKKLPMKAAGVLPVARAWYQEGNPCLLSTIALFGGFAVFLSSHFALNRTFGAYMLLSLGSGLVGDLVLLPVMLHLFPGLLRARMPRSLAKKAPVAAPVAVTTTDATVAAAIEDDAALPEESFMFRKTAASLALAWILTPANLTSANSAPAPNADQVLKEMANRVTSQDESAKIVMTIGEANGASKKRELEVRRKAGAGQKVLVKLQSPSDLRGTALLSVSEKGKDDQWLYLPSSKQTRRIVSSKKNGNFLDSELSYEDMGAAGDKKFTNSIARMEGNTAVVESKIEGGDSSYSRLLTWVPLDSYLATKVEYYDKNGKLLKVSELGKYAKFDKGIWRAQEVLVKNVQNNRTTKLEVKDLKVNKGLDDNEFTVNALQDE